MGKQKNEGWEQEQITDEELKNNYINNDDYWVLIYCPQLISGSNLFIEIEEKYYTGDKNEEFYMVILQPGKLYFPFAGICFANKKYMNKDKLIEILKKNGMDSYRSFIGKDEILGKEVDIDMDLFEKMKNRYFKYKRSLN